MRSQIVALSAVVAVASAQSSKSCTQTATYTISSQADVTPIASCSKFDGSIAIASTPSGTIALDGPKEVTGSITATNASTLTGLTSSTIATIGKSFSLASMTVLSNLQFDALTSVDTIDFEALPALSSLNFAKSVSECSSLSIINTFLSSLDGINLDTADKIKISDNSRLTTFSTQIGNITDTLDIDNNGQNLAVEFPNLIWASSLTLRNISSLSIPSLSTVNGSFGIYGSFLTELKAPNLTSVGNFATGSGGITINDNADLKNITLDELTSCGGLFQISDDKSLNAIDFPELAKIGGALDFTGNFTTPELPKITNIKGAFNIQSQQEIDCTGFDKLKPSSKGGNGVVQGSYTCTGNEDNTTTTTDGSGTGSGSGSSGSGDKGAASTVMISAGVIGLSVVGGLFQLL